MTNKLGRLSGGLLLALYAGLASAAYQANLHSPVTPMASATYDLHLLLMYAVLAIFCIVYGVMFYSIYAHRRSAGQAAEQFHDNTTVEFIWTVIPFVILVGMAWPATSSLIAFKDSANPEITIRATGYQWKWGYDYLKGEGEGIAILSALSTPRDQIDTRKPKGENYLMQVDNPLVLPVGKNVRVLTTADDVIHSFWVPALGIKQDAIPGFDRDVWFRADKEGTYLGQCAQLCGEDHGFMPIVIEVVSQEKYTQWVAIQKSAAGAPNRSAGELKTRGDKTGDAPQPDKMKAARD